MHAVRPWLLSGIKHVVSKLFGELTERYRNRAGGYTRIIKVGYRFGDNAPVSILEFIPDEKKKEKAKAKEKTKAKDKDSLNSLSVH